MKRKPKVRKPRKNNLAWFSIYHGEEMVTLTLRYINSVECRKLAAWLLKSAAYLDSKREGK